MAKRRRSPDARRSGGSIGSPSEPEAPRRGWRQGWPALAAVGVIAAGAIIVLIGGLAGTGTPSATEPVTPTVAQSVSQSETPSDAPSAPPTDASGPTGAPIIAGIPCDVDEGTAYHVHAHLNIRIDGQLQTIPDDVGRTPACLYWLHTHATSGVIHVEAPATRVFTLGQFFDLWGQPLSATTVAGRTIGPGESLFMFVDGRPHQGDPREIPLGNLVAIEFQVGTGPLEPLPYTFPAEFQ